MRRKKVSPTHCNHTGTLGLSWPARICEMLLNRADFHLYRGVLQILSIITGQLLSGQSRKVHGLKPQSGHLIKPPPVHNGTWKELCTELLGRGRVTGHALGSRAPPWHQNPRGINSLAIIYELFGVLSMPMFFPSPHPPSLWSNLCVCREIDI